MEQDKPYLKAYLDALAQARFSKDYDQLCSPRKQTIREIGIIQIQEYSP